MKKKRKIVRQKKASGREIMDAATRLVRLLASHTDDPIRVWTASYHLRLAIEAVRINPRT